MRAALEFTRRPPDFLIEPVVRRALEEDIGTGDITSDCTVPAGAEAHACLAARAPGVIAGLVAADIAFRLIDPALEFKVATPDGSRVTAGAVLAEIAGPARAILAAERVALNFAGHLSGIATATRALVDAVEGTRTRILCTRKTTPGLRVLEKYAVRCGGGLNHRFGLDDAVLVKDNHIAAAGGIAAALAALKGKLGPMTAIEVEVDTLIQLEEALAEGVERILLDNMTPDELRRAVVLAKGRAKLEASGNVRVESVRAIAKTGVDFISSGSITHSAPALDLGLDF